MMSDSIFAGFLHDGHFSLFLRLNTKVKGSKLYVIVIQWCLKANSVKPPREREHCLRTNCVSHGVE